MCRNFRERRRRRRRGTRGARRRPRNFHSRLVFSHPPPAWFAALAPRATAASRESFGRSARRETPRAPSLPETSRPRRDSNPRSSRARRPAPPSSFAGPCGETRVGTAPTAASPAGPPPHRPPSVRHPRRRRGTIPFLEWEPSSFASPGKVNRRFSTRRRRRNGTPAPTAGKPRPRRAKPPPTRPPRRVNPRAAPPRERSP
mmetsp:Transcript_9469/g.43047  ORF Transcript_9469/g.43047 Transcript_9469/m.43047 type:complete len:201 (-) Transcript_9469:329-931(-)